MRQKNATKKSLLGLRNSLLIICIIIIFNGCKHSPTLQNEIFLEKDNLSKLLFTRVGISDWIEQDCHQKEILSLDFRDTLLSIYIADSLVKERPLSTREMNDLSNAIEQINIRELNNFYNTPLFSTSPEIELYFFTNEGHTYAVKSFSHRGDLPISLQYSCKKLLQLLYMELKILNSQ